MDIPSEVHILRQRCEASINRLHRVLLGTLLFEWPRGKRTDPGAVGRNPLGGGMYQFALSKTKMPPRLSLGATLSLMDPRGVDSTSAYSFDSAE